MRSLANAFYLPSEPQTDADNPRSSRFHQLHCLTSLRVALQRASRGEDIGVDWRDDVHWPHCLQYLRESILCFADPTIERAPIVNGTRLRGIDGARDIRTCRDDSVLFKLREQSGVASG
jgi:hypothetical protein